MQVAIYFFICVDLSLALFEEPALFPLPFLVRIKNKMATQTLSLMRWAPFLPPPPISIHMNMILFLLLGTERILFIH